MPAHPFERHLENVAATAEHENWTPSDGALPALYLSHGAPPLFEDPVWMAQLFAWARSSSRVIRGAVSNAWCSVSSAASCSPLTSALPRGIMTAASHRRSESAPRKA